MYSLVKRPNFYPFLYCIGLFFFTQIVYSFLHLGWGNYFSSYLATDPLVLPFFKKDFFKTLFYYHKLPPGYVAYAYGFQILFPPDGKIGVYFFHTFLGVWSVISLYLIQKRLGINRFIALTILTLYLINPAFILYQTMGWYDFSTACLLIISVWSLSNFADKPTFRNGLLFFSIVALLCSIRSIFHFTFYLLPLTIVCLIIFRKHWKVTLLSASLPFLLVFGMYFKNYYLFKIFSVSSYGPENIYMVTMQWNFPIELRYEGIKRGFFSDLALCHQSPDGVGNLLLPDYAYTGTYCYKVIAQKYRDNYLKMLGTDYKDVEALQPIPGQTLPHRLEVGNIGMDKEFGRNAFQALIHYPRIFLLNLKECWRLYYSDSVSYFYENMQNTRKLPTWLPYRPSRECYYILTIIYPFLIYLGACCTLFNRRLIYFASSSYLGLAGILNLKYAFAKTRMDWTSSCEMIRNNIWFMIFFLLLTLLIYQLKIKKYNFKPLFNHNQRAVILFIICNAVYASIVMTSFTGNEQQRYRFYITGLFFILFGLYLQLILPLVLSLYRMTKIIIAEKFEFLAVDYYSKEQGGL